VRGHDIDRVLQPASHREQPADAAVGVAGRPEIFLAHGATGLARDDAAAGAGTDRGQRDRIVGHERVGLQAGLQGREVGERLHRRTGLALRLRGTIELAQAVGKAPDHRQDAAGLVLNDQRRALDGRAHAQFSATADGHGSSKPAIGAWGSTLRALLLGGRLVGLDHANIHDIVEAEIAP
jgi:hypothetical protein